MKWANPCVVRKAARIAPEKGAPAVLRRHSTLLFIAALLQHPEQIAGLSLALLELFSKRAGV